MQYNVNSGVTCYDLMNFFLNYGGYNKEFDILNQRSSRNNNNSNNRFGVVKLQKIKTVLDAFRKQPQNVKSD